MANANWAGRWIGGRIQEGVRGRTWWLEKRHGGKKYAIRLVGITSDREAIAELDRWKADPTGYQPPAVREELAALDAEELELAKAEDVAARVVIDSDLIDRFAQAMRDGYDPRGPRTEAHIAKVKRCLSAWSDALDGEDLRRVRLGDLLRHLDGWDDKRSRVAAIKAMTKWMRSRDILHRSEDPTVDLQCLQARVPTPMENAAKVYPADVLELTYRHIANQDVRDLYWLRIHSGLHETEVRRIAKGECVIRELEGQGKIAATVAVLHKSRETHLQSVDAPTLERIKRIMTLKTWPTEKTLRRNREKAAASASEEKEEKVPEVYIGNLRATRTTLAEEIGSVVLPKSMKKGVPLELIARTHGHSPDTAAKFYSGKQIPPMVCVPVKLLHPDDP